MANDEKNWRDLDFPTKELKNNKEFMLENLGCFKFASSELQNDRELALKAVMYDEDYFEYISYELKSDRELALNIVKENGDRLEHIDSSFRNNKEIVLEAIKQDANAFRYASDDLRNNKKFLLKIIKENYSSALKSEIRKHSENFQRGNDLDLEIRKQVKLAEYKDNVKEELSTLINFNPENYNHNSEVSKHKNMVHYSDLILEKIEFYTKQNQDTLNVANDIYHSLVDLNPQQEEMKEIKNYILLKFDFSLTTIKNDLIKFKNESIEFIEKLEKNQSIFNFTDVKEVDFNLYCETITNRYNNKIKKIEIFADVRDFLRNLLTEIVVIFQSSNDVKISSKANLEKKCNDEYVEDNFEIIFNEFSQEVENIDKRYFDIIKSAFNDNLSQSSTIDILKIITKYRKKIETFFMGDRISLIQKYNEHKKSELLQKVDTEQTIFNFSLKFMKDIKSIIESEDNKSAKQIINQQAQNIVGDKIAVLGSISKDIGMNDDIQSQFLKLEKQNFETFLNDIKDYSEALEKREKEIQSLMFKMKKDLEREK